MSDQFDVHMRKAVKEAMGRSMQGLEFTPELQRKVLDRIHAGEAAGPAPAQRPFPRTLTGPVAWLAAAAAAFAIAMNVDGVDLFNRSMKDSAPAESVSPQAPPNGAVPAPTSAPALGAPKDAEYAPPTDQQTDDPKANQAVSSFSGQGGTTTSPGSPGSAERVGSRGSLELPVPPQPSADTKTPAPAPGQPDEVPAPGQLKSGIMGIAAAQGPERLALTPLPGDRLAELRTAGVFAYDAQGQQLWERPLEGVDVMSRLRAAADGSLAISAGARVYYLAADGAVRTTLTLPDMVTDLAVGPDGRLAAAHGRSVTVYQGDTQLFAVDGVDGPVVTFGPDGSLAVLSLGEQPVLCRFDKTGKRVAKEVLAGGFSPSLTYEPATAFVLAGRQAVDVTGRVAWELPLVPQGAAPVGTAGVLVAWDTYTIVGLQATDGAEVWRAALPNREGGIQRVVVSPDGNRVAVLAHTASGPMLWVLSGQGQLSYTEQLPALPVDMAFVRDVLFLQMNEGLQSRKVSER